MKIYTKSGDEGDTSLIGGKRVSKSHPQIDVYGEVDELNSWLGFIICKINDGDKRDLLQKVQNELFNLGALLATPAEERANFKLPEIKLTIVSELELVIDQMQATLPPLKNFILPGGTEAAAICHIARTRTRFVERKIVEWRDAANDTIPGAIQLINRLSDFLFVLSRYLNLNSDPKVEEIIWKGNA